MFQKLSSELVTQIEKMPPLLHREMEEMLQNTGEQKVIPEAWSWITWIPQKASTSSHNATSPENPSNLFKSLMVPSRHPLLGSPSHWTTLPTTLQPNSTLLQPTLHTQLNILYQVPSQSLPLCHKKQGKHAKTSCRCPHHSVSPTAGAQGRWMKKINFLRLILQ